MKINFQCPSCGVKLRVDEKFSGRSVPCPRCAKELLIPALERDASSSEILASDDARGESSLPEPTRTHSLTTSQGDGELLTNEDADSDFDISSSLVATEDEENVDEEESEFQGYRDEELAALFPFYEPTPIATGNVYFSEKPPRSKEEDEEVVPTQSKMPSVDELII
ncbi:MAG: hypothetical protein KIG81_06545 [Thermoguttaceae bacterium]|nr:hypothetical protein [Thermoguttaceae bacterium]